MNRRRVLDWRFLVALTVLLLAAYLVLVGVNAVQENNRKGKRIENLIIQVDHAAQERREATDAANAQRRALLDQQADLLAQVEDLQRQTRQLQEHR